MSSDQGYDPQKLKSILQDHRKRYRKTGHRWKLYYRILLVTSALFSTSAAVVGKLDVYTSEASGDIAAILAGLAAVITTLVACLDFQGDWQLNRRSYHEVELIALDAEKSDADPDKILAALQDVVRRRSRDLSNGD